MKITDYQKVSILSDDDVLLIDGINGTKTVDVRTLTKEVGKRNDIYDMLDDYGIPYQFRRNIFRGKMLGSGPTDKDYDEIGAGTYKGLFLGDYWVINNKVYRIVDFGYWLNTGDTLCTEHHLVIMPDKVMYSTVMNDTITSEGGYIGSKMYKENLTNAKNRISSDFGENHILSHRELFVKEVTDGRPTMGAWKDSKVDLPNEVMMYGCYVHTPAASGMANSYRHTVDKVQLALMKIHPIFINPYPADQWLRDVVSANGFAVAGIQGAIDSYISTSNLGVRPHFGIKK